MIIIAFIVVVDSRWWWCVASLCDSSSLARLPIAIFIVICTFVSLHSYERAYEIRNLVWCMRLLTALTIWSTNSGVNLRCNASVLPSITHLLYRISVAVHHSDNDDDDDDDGVDDNGLYIHMCYFFIIFYKRIKKFKCRCRIANDIQNLCALDKNEANQNARWFNWSILNAFYKNMCDVCVCNIFFFCDICFEK